MEFSKERIAARKGNYKREKHSTGYASTSRMLMEISRITGYKQAVIKEIVLVFLKVVYNHLINHRNVSLRWIGSFYFSKTLPRRAMISRGVDKNGKRTIKMGQLGATCRVKFRPSDNLRQESRWFPVRELEEVQEANRKKEEMYLEYLESQKITVSG